MTTYRLGELRISSRTLVFLAFIAVFALALPGALSLLSQTEAIGQPNLPARTPADSLPLPFIPNVGQADEDIRFISHSLTGTFSFMRDRIQWALSEKTSDTLDQRQRYANLEISFVHSEESVSISGAENLPGKVNYLLGNDPARWQTNVPSYGEIHYRALYPGIDLTVEGNQALVGQLTLKGTYTVAPFADPGLIRWRYDGASAVELDTGSGNLFITILQGPDNGEITLVDHAPVAWQEIGGRRQPVEAAYAIGQDGSVGFSLGAYDPSHHLVIDPTLAFSTYLGGTINEHANAVAFDREGNLLFAGYTESIDFPTTPDAFLPAGIGGTCISPPPFQIPFPCNDGFLTKISADGSTILYSTYLGGTGDDGLLGLAVDDFGDMFLTGWTTSLDFPTVKPIQPNNGGGGNRTPDAFIARLSADGTSLHYSTYLGGGGRDYGDNLAIDSSGNAYVTGWTESADFPTLNAVEPAYLGGFFDGFVAKIIPDGTALTYSTFIGGSDLDYTFGIDSDDAGHAYLTGFTLSPDLATVNAYQPTFGGGIEAYVTKLLPDGSDYVFITYFGSDDTRAYDIRVNDAGSIYIVGLTSSATFPLVNPLQGSLTGGMYDAMMARFLPDGSDLDFSTYLGGSDHEVFHTLALDADDNLYFAGWGSSMDFPLVNPLQSGPVGGVDALFGRVSADLTTLEFSTYFGGTGWDYARAIAVDSSGNIAIAGPTSSTDFPVLNPVQPSLQGESDSFLLLVEPSDPVAPLAGFSSSSPDPLGETTVFTNTSTGTDLSFQWDFGDGSPIVTDTHPSHLYGAAGVYTVTLTASNIIGSDTAVGSVQIEVQEYFLYLPFAGRTD